MTGQELPGESATAGERPGMWSRQGAYELSWHDLGTALDSIARSVRADGFTPDVVLGVARGGLLAASYLTCALDVPQMSLVRVRRTRDDSQYAAKRPPLLEQEGPVPKPGTAVLVVDDIVGTGATADVVREHLRTAGVTDTDVRFAALVRNHRSGYVPDYCPAVVDDWVVFPWEQGWGRTAGTRPFPLGEAR
ncbi:phosphoribosyltransferase domain-containing protein [Streptomyces sp. NBC_00820]|uniref:phosphoribosyltransferase n=1 Tax=Streptomyces sp. NBC_00820 TaxID=2975842 RepID=UPI002ED36672|nr:phosphoribosyltransferase domain-containing protein [Streptomyces sp. NBC_00820]